MPYITKFHLCHPDAGVIFVDVGCKFLSSKGHFFTRTTLGGCWTVFKGKEVLS